MYVKVNKRMSQYGPFKALELADGSKVNVSSKSKFYNLFEESGEYNVTLGTSQKGSPMVVAATKLGSSNVSVPVATPTVKLAQNTLQSQNIDKKIDFEKDKQKDIMIECYMGKALDYLIATKHETGFSVEDIVKTAGELINGHRSLAALADSKSGHGHGEDILDTVPAGPSVPSDKELTEKHERVPDETPSVQEDIPF